MNIHTTEPKPWEGEPRQLYPEDEERGVLRESITEALVQHMGDLGIKASRLADVVAEHHYDQEADVATFTTGDVELEVSRMLGTSIRMASNNALFPIPQNEQPKMTI